MKVRNKDMGDGIGMEALFWFKRKVKLKEKKNKIMGANPNLGEHGGSYLDNE
jgi:hypothetical protein